MYKLKNRIISRFFAVITGLVPVILVQRVTNLVNKFAVLLHKYRFNQDCRNKSGNDWCWGRLLSAYCSLFKYPSPADKSATSPAGGEVFRPQCAPDATGFLSDVYKRGTRARKFLADGVQCGRSMIEMLGVLAIIAVLSVGGIAGYSKAMEKFKLNKAMSEYSMLIYGILEHIDDFRKYRNTGETRLSNVLEALDIIPKSWKRDEKNDFIDDNGYTIRVFNHEGDDFKGTLTIDFYLGGYRVNESGNRVTDSFPSSVCEQIINNIAVPLHTMMYRVWMFGANANFYGSPYCGGSKKCLKDVTLAEAHKACTGCVKDNYCALVFYF